MEVEDDNTKTRASLSVSMPCEPRQNKVRKLKIEELERQSEDFDVGTDL